MRGQIKIKADCVNVTGDTFKLQFSGEVTSKKFFCCGEDNPYLLFERARLLTEREQAQRAKVPKKQAPLLSFRRLKINRVGTEEEIMDRAVKNTDLTKDWVRVTSTNQIYD